jgi:hypothetical protein
MIITHRPQVESLQVKNHHNLILIYAHFFTFVRTKKIIKYLQRKFLNSGRFEDEEEEDEQVRDPSVVFCQYFASILSVTNKTLDRSLVICGRGGDLITQGFNFALVLLK